ncbi:hypothetical protein BGZ73_001922 [Actinomortierella ambigua]|nr:hypothetical protein BGZ73_001922 [Actinomortierella ambigua]
MRLSKVLFIVASAALALAQDAIVSKPIFSGKDTTNMYDSGAEIYQKIENHPSAAAALLVYAAQKTSYEPHTSRILKAIYPYQALEMKLRKFQGFKFSETRLQITIKSSSRGELYEEVKKAYDGVENKAIAANIRNLVPVENPEGAALKTWLLSVPIIRRDPTFGRVTIKLARLTLRLDTDDDGKVEIVAGQEAKFVVSEFELDPRYLNEHATTLASKIPSADIGGYKLFFTSKGDNESSVDHDDDIRDDSMRLDLEGPGQSSFLERIRKAWSILWVF